MSSSIIFGAVLQLWPYRLFFFGLTIIALSLISVKGVVKTNQVVITVKSFGIALLGGQLLAVIATVIFVVWSLNWQINPSPTAIENWGGIYWHFYVDSSFSEIGLSLTVLGVIQASEKATWSSIGFNRPNISIFLVIIVVAALYFALHFAISPICQNLSKWIFLYFDIHLNQVDGGLDLAKLDVWLLRQIAGHIGAGGAAVIVLWIGVFTSVIEEVFYRGLLLTALLERVPVWAAIVGQALLFAAMHMDFVRLPYLIALGLILGYLVKRTSSLLPAVLLHIVVNVLSLTTVIA